MSQKNPCLKNDADFFMLIIYYFQSLANDYQQFRVI